MKQKSDPKKLLAFCVALITFASNLLFALEATLHVYAQASQIAGISSLKTYSTPGNDPWGTAFDSKGRIWVALPGCDIGSTCSSTSAPGKIALFDPSTMSWVSVVTLPTGYGQPLFITADPSDNVWFSMPVTNTIGEYIPSTTSVAQWAVPTAGSGPWGIASDSKGKIWFAEHYGYKIGSFNPTTQAFQEIATPATNSQPYGITVDNSNNVWFTENADSVALIGEYTAGGTLLEYKIRNTATSGTGLTPHLITIDPNGNPWWSEGWVGGVGRLNLVSALPGTNNGVTEYFYPHCNGCSSHTSGVSTDTLGDVWIDDSILNQYGYMPLSGGAFSLYYAAPGSHPHDGLRVDSQNRAWFTAEFANTLYLAIPSTGSSTPTPTPTSTPTATATSTSTPTPTSMPTSWTTQARDTFQRANQGLWGTASDGQTWGGDANAQNAFSISGNAGLVTNTGSNSYSAVLGASETNAEVYLTGSLSAFSNSNFGSVLRWTDGNNWYKAYIDGSQLIIQKKIAGVTTLLASVPFTATAGTLYTIHFRAVGTTLSANVWASSGNEPSSWMATVTDSSLTSGFSGLRGLTQSGTLMVTSFTANAPSSTTPTPTSTPAPTPTATVGVTPSATPTFTPTPTSTPGTTVATDTFQRTNQSLWGTASDGQTWGGDANAQNVFSISGNAGLVTNTGSNSYSAVLGASETNAEVYLTGSLSAFSNSNFGSVLRWTDGNNWYKAYIDGSQLIIQKKIAGVTTLLASVPFTATAGTLYTIHFRAVGTTLNANVWASFGSEPSSWMATVTDSSLTSGYAGLRALTQSGTLMVTSFVAKQD
ncbi:hypothetical protein KSD_11650 [Ktedonobacter sp. SOSP1-85]|uniref:virginiamycin B lyase family protein n=1 Tax=Ktedonobacter sp. SOSP1-85 TaxID=2778367 RepID=UPI0019150B99|nr:hypothetical protein [Ktedonobacter sp. SOSP1-85]GHO73394.1 hypothetical protein KSD_11650 [Ktedonobacter sp. SOSP1-85]